MLSCFEIYFIYLIVRAGEIRRDLQFNVSFPECLQDKNEVGGEEFYPGLPFGSHGSNYLSLEWDLNPHAPVCDPSNQSVARFATSNPYPLYCTNV